MKVQNHLHLLLLLKVFFCPHCQNKLLLKIEKEDLDQDTKRFPTPLFILHKNGCGKYFTMYFDSILNISLIYKDKKDVSKWKFVKTFEI